MGYFLVLLGLFGLIKGARIFIEGISFIANILKIPKVIIGLTIVAIGLSLPEASISIIASLNKNPDLAVNNVFGSNFFNMLMVLGICALFKDIPIADKNILKRDLPVLISFYILIFIFCLCKNFGKLEGIFLLILFAIYIFSLVLYAIKNKIKIENEFGNSNNHGILKNIFFVILGGIAIKYCGDLVVDNATEIANSFGLSSSVVGFTIVSIGIGFPELVMSIIATKKNQNEIILGSMIGTNIVNTAFTLGLSSWFYPINIDQKMFVTLITLIFSTLLIFVFCKKSQKIKRLHGIILIGIYISYSLYKFFFENNF